MPGEVVGLIGNNGAGKSTLLNAIGGYVPSKGNVQLLGRDVSRSSAHQRARRGLGRTFQAARLYPELTVRDTVQLALEARDPTSFWGSLLWVPSIRPERRKYTDSKELIDFLGSVGTPTATSPSSPPARAASSSSPRCSRSHRA